MDLKIIGTHAAFDGMAWSFPGERLAELGWTLRHGTPTGSDLLTAASVISAYAELVRCPRSKRVAVVRRLREACRMARGGDDDG